MNSTGHPRLRPRHRPRIAQTQRVRARLARAMGRHHALSRLGVAPEKDGRMLVHAHQAAIGGDLGADRQRLDELVRTLEGTLATSERLRPAFGSKVVVQRRMPPGESTPRDTVDALRSGEHVPGWTVLGELVATYIPVIGASPGIGYWRIDDRPLFPVARSSGGPPTRPLPGRKTTGRPRRNISE